MLILAHYYWYCYNQKQSSGAVLQKKCFYKFPKIHKKTPHLFFRTSASAYALALFTVLPQTFVFSKAMSHIFLGWVFSELNLLTWNNRTSIFQTLSQTPIFNPVEYPRQSFFSKIVNSLKPIDIFAKNATLFSQVLKTPL